MYRISTARDNPTTLFLQISLVGSNSRSNLLWQISSLVTRFFLKGLKRSCFGEPFHPSSNQSILLLSSPIFLYGNSFFWPIIFKTLLKVSIFCSKLSYIASYVLNIDIIHIMYLNCIYTSWTAIARLIISQLYS